MTELPSSEILNIQEFSLVDLRVFLKIGRADELEAIAIGTIKKKKKLNCWTWASCISLLFKKKSAYTVILQE